MNDNPPSNKFLVSIDVPQTIIHAHTVLTSMKGSSKAPLYTSAACQPSSMQAFPLFFSAECGNQENEDNLHSYVYHHELGC